MYFSEKIVRKIAIIEKALSYLRSRAHLKPEDIEGNYELRSALERNLQIAIEAALDIGEMIIAEEEFGVYDRNAVNKSKENIEDWFSLNY